MSTRNHMFGRVIWDKLPECVFENFGIAWAISKFSKITRVIYPQNCPNQTCGYWLITPNQQTLCIQTNIFQQRAKADQRMGNYKTSCNCQITSFIINNRVIIVLIKTSPAAPVQWKNQYFLNTFSNTPPISTSIHNLK